MHEDDSTTRGAITAELQAVTETAARLHRELDVLESDLTRAVETLMRATGRGDLAVSFLRSLGARHATLH